MTRMSSRHSGTDAWAVVVTAGEVGVEIDDPSVGELDLVAAAAVVVACVLVTVACDPEPDVELLQPVIAAASPAIAAATLTAPCRNGLASP